MPARGRAEGGGPAEDTLEELPSPGGARRGWPPGPPKELLRGHLGGTAGPRTHWGNCRPRTRAEKELPAEGARRRSCLPRRPEKGLPLSGTAEGLPAEDRRRGLPAPGPPWKPVRGGAPEGAAFFRGGPRRSFLPGAAEGKMGPEGTHREGGCPFPRTPRGS
ncbi:proline-rich proteoglycan 2-like [Penaeus monodon]|uniref:proline-rich proteoglycan 2-like n=1 Tax=Penaeus monodon TaxID=6687 RepID=UPI0018A78E9C|nr:proline-rich proteoglycan 2-like [Penaeus monodon]